MTTEKTVTTVWNMVCPKCGRDDEIDIAATVWIRLCPDGTNVTEAACGDHEWDDSAVTICGACGHQGEVCAFNAKARGQQ